MVPEQAITGVDACANFGSRGAWFSPTRAMILRRAWWVLLGVATWVSVGRAQSTASPNAPPSAAIPARVIYRAPPECPDRGTFLERVSTRSAFDLTEAPEAFGLSITLNVSADGSSGELRTTSMDGADGREVTAPSCAEVADALALIAALFLERAQRERASSVPPSTPEPEEPALAASALPAPATTIDLGLAAFTAFPVTTIPVAGGELSLRVERGLSYGVSVSFASSAPLSVEATPAEFALGLLTVGVGSPSFPRDSSFRVSVLLGAQGGFLNASGLDAQRTLAVRRAYLTAGASSRVSVDLSSTARFFLDVGVFVPFHERRFHTRDPYVSVGATLPVVANVAVGLALGL